jgi:hypothetical protein
MGWVSLDHRSVSLSSSLPHSFRGLILVQQRELVFLLVLLSTYTIHTLIQTFPNEPSFRRLLFIASVPSVPSPCLL